MRKQWLAAAVAAGFFAGVTSVASAADLELPHKMPRAHAAPGWTGCYGGLHLGLGAMKDTWTDETQSIWGFGLLAGAQVGCNYQLGRFVVGLESEFWGSSLKTQQDFAEFNFAEKTTTANPWTFASSIRAGLTFDQTLVYLKGGVVWGSFSYEFTSTNFAERGSAINTGVLFGLGFEHSFAPLWTVKVETDVVMFSGLEVPIATEEGGSRFTISATQVLFKVGFNRRFAGGFSLALDE
jgi:outer membrane immunogenic protein